MSKDDRTNHNRNNKHPKKKSTSASASQRPSSSASASANSPSPPRPSSRPSYSSSPRSRRRNPSNSHSQSQSHPQSRSRTSSIRSTRSNASTNTHQTTATSATSTTNVTNVTNATNSSDATNASRELFLSYASKVRPNANKDIMSDWCTIESDPGVFTSLIESFGVSNAQVTELWSLDDDSLQCILDDFGKVHGLVFLFKWQSSNSSRHSSSNGGGSSAVGGVSGSGSGSGPNGTGTDTGDGNTNGDEKTDGDNSRKPLGPEEVPEDLFFAKQVTTNACATQAILSILLNAQDDTNTSTSTSGHENVDTNTDVNTDTGTGTGTTLKLGEMLTALKSFTTSFPADLKGEAIGASDEIRTAHNSFARKEAFLMDETKKRIAGDDDDVFHFIAYVPHSDGNVYELDGLQPGPISVGTYKSDDTNSTSSSPSSSSNPSQDFAWLATARTAIQTRIEKYASSEIKFNLMALTADKRNVIQSKLHTLLSSGVIEDDERIQNYNVALVQEEEQRIQWKQENERRRHNYIPFCMELIRALAMSGTLQDCTRKAKEKVQAARLKQRLG